MRGRLWRPYLDTVERFDPASNAWEAVAPMSGQRSSMGVAVLQGKLYAVGGWDGSTCLDTVERFDPATNAWEAVVPMSAKRQALGVASM